MEQKLHSIKPEHVERFEETVEKAKGQASDYELRQVISDGDVEYQVAVRGTRARVLNEVSEHDAPNGVCVRASGETPEKALNIFEKEVEMDQAGKQTP